jgi:hypothetical protein
MDVELRPSLIHQRGVFALRAFKRGDVVLRWDVSQRVAADEVASLDAAHRAYLHPYDATTLVMVQSPERFVNHSCDHNTEVRGFSDVAIRDIAPGEEITSNYETDGAGVVFECRCGSPSCRKRIGRINLVSRES